MVCYIKTYDTLYNISNPFYTTTIIYTQYTTQFCSRSIIYKTIQYYVTWHPILLYMTVHYTMLFSVMICTNIVFYSVHGSSCITSGSIQRHPP